MTESAYSPHNGGGGQQNFIMDYRRKIFQKFNMYVCIPLHKKYTNCTKNSINTNTSDFNENTNNIKHMVSRSYE